MVIGFALTDTEMNEKLRLACDKVSDGIQYMDMCKNQAWEYYWKKVDLFIMDDSYMQTHATRIAKLDHSQRIVCIGNQVAKHDNLKYMDGAALAQLPILPSDITEWIHYVENAGRYERIGKILYVIAMVLVLCISLTFDHPVLKRYGVLIGVIIGSTLMDYFNHKARQDSRLMKHLVLNVLLWSAVVLLLDFFTDQLFFGN